MASWTEEIIQAVWEKGTKVQGYDYNVWRKDSCGAWINRNLHGSPSINESHTSYKWQIDHIKPESKGGTVVYRIFVPCNGLIMIRDKMKDL